MSDTPKWMLGPPKWMLDAVAMNPSYTGWGPGDGFLGSRDPRRWDCNGFYDDFSAFWNAYGTELDDSNECVNFYFFDYEKDGQHVLELNLWIIHPRKGASKGVLVRHMAQDDVPRALEWLRHAARRNAERFAKLERR